MAEEILQIPILYSDDSLLVLNKPAGISVHGPIGAGARVSGPTIADFLLEKYPEIANVGEDPVRPGIVHRLDKDTSGVMVVARTQEAFLALKELFKTRKVEKTYRALACGKITPEQGTISFPIGRLVKNPLKRGVEEGGGRIRGARDAVTEYRVLKSNELFSFVELKPKTGRMHQIRVHLKAIHHPVACDIVYGGSKVCCPGGAGRQLLHAYSISFSYPEGRKLYFEADLPDDFRVALESVL